MNHHIAAAAPERTFSVEQKTWPPITKSAWVEFGSTYASKRLTLQGTNISPKNRILKMIFLFPRWDMLVPWRVTIQGTKPQNGVD